MTLLWTLVDLKKRKVRKQGLRWSSLLGEVRCLFCSDLGDAIIGGHAEPSPAFVTCISQQPACANCKSWLGLPGENGDHDNHSTAITRGLLTKESILISIKGCSSASSATIPFKGLSSDKESDTSQPQDMADVPVPWEAGNDNFPEVRLRKCGLKELVGGC
jgi:hypothetical protein